MKIRDPFSSAAFFVSSLWKEPLKTLNTTIVGITHGTEASGLKYTTPAMGVSGLGLTFLGAASASVLPVAAGLFGTAIAGGRYLDMGNEVVSPKDPPPDPIAP